MTEPDPPGTHEKPKPDHEEPGLALPSWVDAAITRSKDTRPAQPAAPVRPNPPRPPPSPVVEEPLEDEPREEDLTPDFLAVEDEARAAQQSEVAETAIEATPIDRDDTAAAIAPSPELTTMAPARKGLALPWLLAAVLFAAAALVMAYLIWLRPR